MKAKESIELKPAYDLSEVALEEAYKLLKEHEPEIKWYVLKVPSQLVSEAFCHQRKFGYTLSLDVDYVCDEWSIRVYDFTGGKTQYREVWSPGA